MQMPPEIVVKNMETTPQVDKLISRGIARLERVCDYIISTHIALERAQRRHRTGDPYRMRIDIRIPDRSDIVVQRSSKASKETPDGLGLLPAQPSLEDEPEPEESLVSRRGIREEPLTALIRRTFDSARRELEKVVDKQRGEVKLSARQQRQAEAENISGESLV